jgi:hypothetical protein
MPVATVRIPILSGVYTDQAGDYRASYPRNLIPVPREQGISKGYLKPAHGIQAFAACSDIDRGGISVANVGSLPTGMYRVIGPNLCFVREDGTIQVLGYVGGGGQVSLDYSFDVLAVASGGNLYYYDGATVTQNTDPDLGACVDALWYEGYFVSTDGTSIVVTELNDIYTVQTLKYGSAEVDPDPIVALFELRNEINAVGRYTIEFFDNVGGDNFPLARISTAQIRKGAVGTHACCVFMDTIAFVGSGRNETLSVYLGANGSALPIATREINKILKLYTETELAQIECEAMVDESNQHLLIHLPDQTLVYDGAASAVIGEPVWFTLDSGLGSASRYRAHNLVWCYGKWISGDPTSNKLGTYVDNISSHYGDVVGWNFGTLIIYNEASGAIFHELEIAGIKGLAALGDNPVVWASYSEDGVTFSMDTPQRVGKIGATQTRLAWLQQGAMSQQRIYKFKGNSDAHFTAASLVARIEPLTV